MHLQAGVANGSHVEFHWQGWKLAAAVFKDTPDPVNGWVTVPGIPGLGLELCMERIILFTLPHC